MTVVPLARARERPLILNLRLNLRGGEGFARTRGSRGYFANDEAFIPSPSTSPRKLTGPGTPGGSLCPLSPWAERGRLAAGRRARHRFPGPRGDCREPYAAD